jgi:hypothetical protein
MSLEKSIQKLTQVIQAANQQFTRFDEPNMPLESTPRKKYKPAPVPTNRFGHYGWNCHWALQAMEEDPSILSRCCHDPSTPIPHTQYCYTRVLDEIYSTPA